VSVFEVCVPVVELNPADTETGVDTVIPVAALAVNETEVLPAGTVTVLGTVTEAAPLVSTTMVPPAGAGALSVTVPSEFCPVTTLGGLKKSSRTIPGGGVIVSMANCEDAPSVAVMVTTSEASTGSVVTAKIALVAFCGTVTEIPACASVELLWIITVVPNCGAGPFRVTVASDEFPPTTLVGEREILITCGWGTTLSDCVTIDKFPVTMAVSVTFTVAATAVVVIGNVADVAYCGMVTVGPFGNCTLGSLLVRFIASPPGGAAATMVTVPVRLPAAPAPPCTMFVLRARLVSASALMPTVTTVVLTDPVVEPCRVAVSVVLAESVMAPPTRFSMSTDDPAGTTTLGGTANAVLFVLVSITVCPPAGAGMLKLISHTIVLPEVTVVPWHEIPASVSEGTTSIPKVIPVEFSVAVSVTSVVFVTFDVITVNWACVAPAGTVTVVGMVTGSGVVDGVAVSVNAAVSVTTAPPEGAGGETVTMPVILDPPAAVNGTT